MVVPSSATPQPQTNLNKSSSPKQSKKAFYLKKGDILETYFDKASKYLPHPESNSDEQYVWKKLINPTEVASGETLESLRKQKNSRDSIKRIDQFT